jgi:hypothetical protein
MSTPVPPAPPPLSQAYQVEWQQGFNAYPGILVDMTPARWDGHNAAQEYEITCLHFSTDCERT